MPPKPTCKVVKRQGQAGARIDPKGCKVRSEKDAAGKVKTTNKQGQQKHKTTQKGREHWIIISGKKPAHATVRSNWDTYTREKIRDFGHENKQAHRILYDTGATGTLMTPALLRKLGENPNRTNNIRHTTGHGATGGPVNMKVLRDVTFWVLIGRFKKQEWVKIKEDVVVATGSFSLFGTSSIKQLGTRYKVKFK